MSLGTRVTDSDEAGNDRGSILEMLAIIVYTSINAEDKDMPT
jgi:hypothetical protein